MRKLCCKVQKAKSSSRSPLSKYGLEKRTYVHKKEEAVYLIMYSGCSRLDRKAARILGDLVWYVIASEDDHNAVRLVGCSNMYISTLDFILQKLCQADNCGCYSTPS